MNNVELKEFTDQFWKFLIMMLLKNKSILGQITITSWQNSYEKIMLRSRLWNQFLEEQTHKSKDGYNKQNSCISLLHEKKRITLEI